MEVYLKKKPTGKKLHDPLAACCAIDESIGIWQEVKLYCDRGKWGAKLFPGSNTSIIIDYNRDKFIDTFMEY